jgi:hypothetical protein
LLLAFTFLLPTPLRSQPADIRIKAEASAKHVTLADTVRVTLTVEGPAPLRVELPKQPLTPDSNRLWHVRDDSNARPTVTPTANGREEWKRVYRLDAFWLSDPPNTPLPITFNAVTVNGQQVAWDSLWVTVGRTGGQTEKPKALPITPIEEVGPPPVKPERSFAVLWVVGAIGLVCVTVLVAVWARSRKAVPVPPREWALAALAKLAEANATGAETVEQVVEIVRRFIQRRFTIPATKLTTAELLAAAAEQGWPVEESDPLRVLLDECDRVKFAGDLPDDGGRRRLVRLARDWVDHVGRPAGPG